MMFARLVKKEEGLYNLTSVVCPGCNTSLTLEISGQSAFLLNQNALIQDVLPDETLDVRERFISGICGTCWDAMFAVSELDEEEMDND